MSVCIGPLSARIGRLDGGIAASGTQLALLALHEERETRNRSCSHHDAELARRYGALSQPSVFLIDGDGVIRWSHSSPAAVGAPTGWAPTRRELIAALFAVYNASGIRVRELPITLDKLLREL